MKRIDKSSHDDESCPNQAKAAAKQNAKGERHKQAAASVNEVSGDDSSWYRYEENALVCICCAIPADPKGANWHTQGKDTRGRQVLSVPSSVERPPAR